MVTHKYAIGESVIWVNEYGVYLGKRTIAGLETRTGRPCYYITPHDAPWFAVAESSLMSEDAAREDAAGKVAALVAAGYVVGPRDRNLNRAHEGRFMVAESYAPGTVTDDAGSGPACIVGDDLHELIYLAVAQWLDAPTPAPADVTPQARPRRSRRLAWCRTPQIGDVAVMRLRGGGPIREHRYTVRGYDPTTDRVQVDAGWIDLALFDTIEAP